MNNTLLDSSLLTSSMFFVGSTFPEDPKPGDAVCKDGVIYLYTGTSWDGLEAIEDLSIRSNTPTETELKPKICIRCGAPMHTNKCEYCKTEYYW